MRRLLAMFLALVATASGASLVALAGPASAQAPAPATDDAGRGLIYDGLQLSGVDGPCPGAFALFGGVDPAASGRSQVACTHGPDPAPEGVDVRQNRPPENAVAASSPSGALAASRAVVGCYGSGPDGPRVQLLYAHSTTAPDRFADYAASFAAWAGRMDQVVNDSAAETGGSRHIRFVTDPSCQTVILDVALSSSAMGDMNTMISELRNQGYSRTDRKYVVWSDAHVYCGIAEIYSDDRADPSPGVNYNNGYAGVPGEVARIDNGCWGQPNLTEAHELMHTLGGVQPTAPNATPGYHCTDESDRLCYADGTVSAAQIRQVCAAPHEALYDCNHDDYFNTAPPPGSYLSTHWNTANSAFLTAAAPIPPPTTTTVPATTTTTRTTLPPPTTTTTTLPPTTTTTTTTTTLPPTTTTTTTVPPTTTTTTTPPTTVPPPPPAGGTPSAPNNLTASQPTRTAGVQLQWLPPTTGTVTGYRIYRGTSPYALSPLATIGVTTSYSDLSAGPQLYFYAVHALNGSNEGPPSNLTGMIGKVMTAAAAYGQLDPAPVSWSPRR
ncbi:MAG: fibronectin type III domain-containing protein [Actinomycetota bacterium]|nr:fibronectin type III domain-containing protein [Actinomycetota bacterium]